MQGVGNNGREGRLTIADEWLAILYPSPILGRQRQPKGGEKGGGVGRGGEWVDETREIKAESKRAINRARLPWRGQDFRLAPAMSQVPPCILFRRRMAESQQAGLWRGGEADCLSHASPDPLKSGFSPTSA